MNILVLGSSGMAASYIIPMLKDSYHIYLGEYNKKRHNKLIKKYPYIKEVRNINVDDERSINKGFKDIDVVINTVDQSNSLVQKQAIINEILCVDTCSNYQLYLDSKQHYDKYQNKAKLINMCGLLPGFSACLLTEDNSNLIFEQNKNTRAGKQGIKEVMGVLYSLGLKNNQRFNNKRYFEVNHVEKILVQNKFPNHEIKYYIRWNSELTNKFFKTIKVLKLNKLFIKLKLINFFSFLFSKKGIEDHQVIIGNGQELYHFKSDYYATAIYICLIIKDVNEFYGVKTPVELTNIMDINNKFIKKAL